MREPPIPENTVVTPLAPMEPADIANAFAYIQEWHARDIDTADAVADDIGPGILFRAVRALLPRRRARAAAA
ncbi:hypothetical protein AMK18_08000 [Streptomyces sp. CB01249]|uniref:hypothetical protein n=2 Tax=unclassified Streptomyces TaxID=2593676 RepID=UPI00094003FC|nr:hypothetical protein [Streptomyces sp. CB01249]OKJ05097.1 hypothetical protein AMK18_08000 [Streptomyces sp. CB01249]